MNSYERLYCATSIYTSQAGVIECIVLLLIIITPVGDPFLNALTMILPSETTG
jgi:hypothetical protein